jgi:chemotaxis methyl-accepting protein methylase
LQGIDVDLPELEPVFKQYLERESSVRQEDRSLKERVAFQPLDFLKEDLTFKVSGKNVPVDVIMFGNVIHDWDDENKLLLLKKAYAALKPGGRIIVYDSFIDDEQVKSTPSLLMSLNMQLVCRGSQFTYKQFTKWMTEVGFANIETHHIDACHDAIIGVRKE